MSQYFDWRGGPGPLISQKDLGYPERGSKQRSEMTSINFLTLIIPSKLLLGKFSRFYEFDKYN